MRKDFSGLPNTNLQFQTNDRLDAATRPAQAEYPEDYLAIKPGSGMSETIRFRKTEIDTMKLIVTRVAFSARADVS